VLNISFLYAALLGYLLGSIPFGYLLTRLAGLGDIRQIGSGNIGATNVLRTGNKGLAALTLLLDGGKGIAAVLLAQSLWPEAGAAAGFAALLGHTFPVWLKFKGGKGVATTMGVIAALSWPVGLITMALWLLVAGLFRYSSLAALVSIGFMPIVAFALKRPDVTWLGVAVIFLVFTKHGANIKRLMNGTETRIGEAKNAPPPA
jgi:glycerol-3-phosphate acyltransferase PlsY